MSKIDIIHAKSLADIQSAKDIMLKYIKFIERELGETLTFQGTDTEFANFPNSYDVLLLAKVDGKPAGACAVKPFNTGICELKRLYALPEFRGHKLGLKLTVESLRRAKALGYSEMYLDTNPDLTHANALYERLGFVDIEKYYDNPLVCSRYMARAV
mgnify:CR=1 FL=1